MLEKWNKAGCLPGARRKLRIKRVIVFIAAVLFFCSWFLRFQNPVLAAIHPYGVYGFRGIYAGALPCTGCDARSTVLGADARLQLVDPGPNLGKGSGTFLLTERYSDKQGGTVTKTISGQWSLVPGPHELLPFPPGQPGSGFLKLSPEGDGVQPLYFYVAEGRELHGLDNSMRELPANVPHVLLRMLDHGDGHEYPVVPKSVPPAMPAPQTSAP
jgi:hypothetical protein